jgi:2-dehydro-3-deoxyphosphogluconate aldolase/(4S)-4-hydroxy-2-oxoglutarate aldolase
MKEEMDMKSIINQFERFGVVPVIAIEDAKDATALGEALLAGGLPCAEVTFRTAAAAESIRTLADQFPDMLVGAGTVLNVEQAQQAMDNGAKFLVTPGFDAAVVEFSLAHKIPIFPGVATPTEINMALHHGLDILKFFPAQALGGVATLKAISGPYGGIRFIPTGGINPSNLADYLKLPAVLACGGSWLVKKSLIAEGAFATITQLVREAMQLVERTRSG